ncbi:acyloxyacyl hydrolase [soil metagenome]
MAIATVGFALGNTAQAQSTDSAWVPSRFLVEYGHNDRGPATNVGRLGVIWPFDVSWNPWGNANLTAYGEATVGRFETRSSPERGKRGVTQLGLTPVLRLYPWGGTAGTFFEAGIGANVFLPKYKAGVHEFSTEYQFGDHLGMGWRFGTAAADEVALRFEHFSNGSIKEPNPGENFIQLRYSRGF